MNKVRDPNIDDVVRLSERNQELCDKLNNLTSKCNRLFETCMALLDENIKYFSNKEKYRDKPIEDPWPEERRKAYAENRINGFKIRKSFITKFYKEKQDEST